MEAAGIEPEDAISQRVSEQQLTALAGEVSALCLHGSGSACHYVASLDPTLVRLIEFWPSLSVDALKTIHAICIDAVLLGNR